MITIIEGPDACGKTTLARSDAFSHDHLYAHQGPYRTDVLAETLEHVISTYKSAAVEHLAGVVHDRLHLGELVYGPLLRRYNALGRVEHRMIERYLLTLQPVVVFALPSEDLMVDLWRRTRMQRVELVNKEVQIRDVYRLYSNPLGLFSELPWVRYNLSEETPEEVRARVEVKRLPANRGPGVGSWDPGHVTLLVGEQVNLNQPGQQLPFIGSVSGAYLTERLDAWGIGERSLYWINAKRPDGTWEDASFIGLLKPLRIIALGNVAREWCAAHGLDHRHSPHPQYWRRFCRSSEYTPLMEALCF